MNIPMTPSTSSMIRAYGYDPATNTLRLEFKDGVQHDYANITPEHYADFRYGSHGKFFHAHLKKSAKHPSRLVGSVS